MNVANLQLEGLYLAVAAINNALVLKGILTQEEVGSALNAAEATALAPEATELSAANRDAILFPLRLLQLANSSADEAGTVPFRELARMVGETK